MSATLSLTFSDAAIAAATRRAAELGVSVEEFATAAVGAAVGEPDRTPPPPLPTEPPAEDGADISKWFGFFRSDVPDWTENHDHYLGRELARDMTVPPGGDDVR